MRDVEAQLIHDMQNTAMVVREAAAQLHDGHGSLSPVTVEHLTEMLARRSDMLVRLLKDLATSHLAGRDDLSLSLQRVSLHDVCAQVLTDRVATPGKRITIDVPVDAVVIADPLRITQVLDNLVTNALRYGGPRIHISTTRVASRLLLSVGDDGPGVPEDLVQTLFDAYVHGSSSHRLGGSGLGLWIVRQLCRAMGGAIEYDGTNGARFIASLPSASPAVPGLGRDVATDGHSVAFWTSDDCLVQGLVTYVAHGLAAGEAVVVAATPDHHKQLEEGLNALGIDPMAARDHGQYLPLDAEALHADLPRLNHIDNDRFESLIARPVEKVSTRWRQLRVYGEIVDLYWRGHDEELALELEACWNGLRARLNFPLLCGYELTDGASVESISGCHDAVVLA